MLWGPAATLMAASNVCSRKGSPCTLLEEGAKVNDSESFGLSLFCVYLLWSCFKHGKALSLCEREDVSFTHRSNDYHMPEGSFLLLRLKTQPSSFSCLYNFLGTYASTPVMLKGSWEGGIPGVTHTAEHGGDQL